VQWSSTATKDSWMVTAAGVAVQGEVSSHHCFCRMPLIEVIRLYTLLRIETERG
jgi:hypothetical protein